LRNTLPGICLLPKAGTEKLYWCNSAKLPKWPTLKCWPLSTGNGVVWLIFFSFVVATQAAAMKVSLGLHCGVDQWQY
jgi:hypothetical protein